MPEFPPVSAHAEPRSSRGVVPRQLGRGVVVAPDAPAPVGWEDMGWEGMGWEGMGWEDVPRLIIGPADLISPERAVSQLHDAWSARQPIVVELACDPEELRQPETWTGALHSLSPSFTLWRERLQFLVWANNYDARNETLVWWHGRKAARLLAAQGVTELALGVDGDGDVMTIDGDRLWIDGGPPDPPLIEGGAGIVHRWSAEEGHLVVTRDLHPDAPLAPDQLAAVDHASGPARVIAPAGSGKTRVLTERVRLLVRRGNLPGTITALAYNTRAADEMRQRLTDVVGSSGPHLRTLNSVALWICASFSPDGPPRVLEEMGARDLVQEIFTVRRQANADTTAPYLSALSTVRLGLVDPAAAEEAWPDAVGLADGFDEYRAALRERNQVDFDEQIYRAIEILLANPEARATAQARCRRLLVDEFQDLTPAHLLLVRLLCAPGFDCFGVGDDDQVIYGYAGATPEFLVDFAAYFPGATDHPLEVNYRCPPAVVGAARHLLTRNADRVAKVIRSPEGARDLVPATTGPLTGGGALVVRTVPGDAMAEYAIDIIRQWLSDGVPASDIAVLARVNAALLPMQVACQESAVPCTTPLGIQALGRTGIRTAFAYLRIGADPGSIRREDIRDTIRRPSRGIAPMVVDMVTKRSTTSVADIRRLAGRLTGRDSAKLVTYADDLELVARAVTRSTSDALEAVRTGIGLDATLSALDGSRAGADRSTHADDLAALQSLAAFHPDAATFAHWLREVVSRPQASGPLVELSTVHRIKGKEWGHVLVVGVSDGVLPHRLSDDIEGERRIFHVALTRADTQAVVIGDVAAPSPFLGELDHDGTPPLRRAPKATVASQRRSDRSAQRTTPVTGEAGPVEAALRLWRSEVARREGVPAYVILNDRELGAVAERAPATLTELSACKGMGPIRLDRWGADILAIVEQAVEAAGN